MFELVPIIGIFMIISVVIGPIWITSYFKARDRQQLHETLRVAYEKGQPVPPELVDSLIRGNAAASEIGLSTAERDLRRAVVLIAVGLGMVGLGWGLWYGIDNYGGNIAGAVVAGSGAIPGLIGVAYLVLWLNKRGSPKSGV